MSIHVMWFRKDFRLLDNQALNLAIQQMTNADRLVCVFQINPQQYREGTANHDYFFTTVKAFFDSHPELAVHYLFGDPLDSFKQLKNNYPDWDYLYFNEDESLFGYQRDQQVIEFCRDAGIHVSTKPDNYIHSAKVVVKDDGTPYRVFTPYYKKWLTLPVDLSNSRQADIGSVTIQRPQNDQQKSGENAMSQLITKSQHDFLQEIGEDVAMRRLKKFLRTGLALYEKNRDIPSLDGTSYLSPYLKTGVLSIRVIWQLLIDCDESIGQITFMKELVWREFYKMIDVYHPEQRTKELQLHYQQLPWRQNQHDLKKWAAGLTGFPLIDAAMRQLNTTGWMHNRLRMLTASFLTKDLLVDWRLGEAYFAAHLIDYDPASNVGGWQWAASTGTDAVPYFRVFNPTTQSQKIDSEGIFIRRFLPELRDVPIKYIHEPHLMSKAEQEKAHCLIGKDYPLPMVNHKEARELTMQWFKQHKQ